MRKQSITKRKLSKYGGRKPMFRYDIRLLKKRMAFLGIHTAELGRKITATAVLTGDKPPSEREVYAIMASERPFPRPDYVRQIIGVLNIPMSEVVIENSTPKATK